ncbi:hypothetical protein LX36DRAFT_219246 [Colletotrichum falcatum]|nr:hypothetical protein LX36DRAFT_219246 [Colletotrichum falcatum]
MGVSGPPRAHPLGHPPTHALSDRAGDQREALHLFVQAARYPYRRRHVAYQSQKFPGAHAHAHANSCWPSSLFGRVIKRRNTSPAPPPPARLDVSLLSPHHCVQCPHSLANVLVIVLFFLHITLL